MAKGKSGEDFIRRLIGNATGGMAASRFDNIVKWAKDSGNEALANKLASGQITPDELHAANVAYFEASRRKPMADAPARQMELDLPEDPGTGMVPYGTKGPGVPVGGPSGPGVAGDLSGPGTRGGQISRPWANNSDYVDPEFRVAPPTKMSVPQRGIALQGQDTRGMSVDEDSWRYRDEGLRGPFDDMDEALDSDDIIFPERGGPLGKRAYRVVDGEFGPVRRPPWGKIGAAGAAAAGGGVAWNMWPREDGERPANGDITDTSGTADLAAESAPPPVVDGPPDYSFQARELMNKLNAMRRKAGGEVPEAKAMMAEINRLLDLSNKQKNAPGYEPPMPTDYHGEAQRLLQKLNARRMEVGGEVPETNQVMAEVRRLQALGDQQRNARR